MSARCFSYCHRSMPFSARCNPTSLAIRRSLLRLGFATGVDEDRLPGGIRRKESLRGQEEVAEHRRILRRSVLGLKAPYFGSTLHLAQSFWNCDMSKMAVATKARERVDPTLHACGEYADNARQWYNHQTSLPPCLWQTRHHHMLLTIDYSIRFFHSPQFSWQWS